MRKDSTLALYDATHKYLLLSPFLPNLAYYIASQRRYEAGGWANEVGKYARAEIRPPPPPPFPPPPCLPRPFPLDEVSSFVNFILVACNTAMRWPVYTLFCFTFFTIVGIILGDTTLFLVF